MVQIPKAHALRRARYPKDEAYPREARLNKPFMVPPEGDTCPVNNLPPELLSRIFELGGTDSHTAFQVENGNDHVLRDVVRIFPEQTNISSNGLAADHDGDKRRGEHVDQESFDTASSFRINVSLVSRNWHNVAISTPSLWTIITGPSLPYAYSPNTHLPLLLKRSNGLPIDIDLGRGSQPDVYPLLVPHVHRWHSVKAEFNSYEDTDAFLDAISRPSVPAASRLTTLQLCFRAVFHILYPLPVQCPTLFCGSAPYLERLTLWGVHVDWNQSWISSASNLTYLELRFLLDMVGPSWVQFATILRGAPALKTLKLYAAGPSLELVDWDITSDAGSGAENPRSPIPLLNLTDFFIGFRTERYAIWLFRMFYMPSLTSLTFDFRADDYDGLIEHLAGPPSSLASPSPDETPQSLLSKLENLGIVCLPCNRSGIEILYGKLQNLKSLSIALHHPWNVLSALFLELLPCSLPGRDVWLPLLETVYISQISNDFGLIRDVVQKRKDVGVPLKSLYLEV